MTINGGLVNRTAHLALALLAAGAVLTLSTYRPARAAPPDPIRRGVVEDLAAAGGSTAGVFSSSITPLNVAGGNRTSALRITVALTGADSVLNLLVTKGGKTLVLPLNGGSALTAATGVRTFTVGVAQAVVSDAGALSPLTYNLSLTTSTRVGLLVVDESPSDDL